MRFRLLAVAFAALFSTGCIELDLKVFVGADGKGRIVERVLFDTAVLDDLFKMMESIAQKGDAKAKKKPQRPWDFDKADLANRAGDRGKGVKLKLAKALADGKRKGWVATYTFANVDDVTLDTDPSERVKGGQKKAAHKAEKKPMRFRLKRGSPAVLEIDVPQQDEKKEQRSKKPPPEQLKRIATMLENLRVNVSVVVEGKVKKSSATHRKGNELTLMTLDFGKLSKDEKNVEKLAMSTSMKDLVELPGVKIEQKDKVSVTFE